MIDIYSKIFKDIFNACEPYLKHDYLNVRGDNSGNNKYCFYSCKKVFEETIKVLDKSRYNGEIIFPENIVFDIHNIYSTDEIVKTSMCYIKQKITIKDGIIKLSNARETDKKERIILFPIDGIYSFSCGNSDFSMVLILEEKNEDEYKIKNISVFNPIRNDIFVFDANDGCKFNDKKIAMDNVYGDNQTNIIFVNDGTSKFSFDLTKLSQMTNNLFISKSIFSSIVELLTTNKNMCIYKINQNVLPFVEFMCNISLLNTRNVGEHIVIEKK